MGERERFRKCEESNSWVWGKNKYRGEKARKVKYSKRTKFQKKRVTRKVYNKNIM